MLSRAALKLLLFTVCFLVLGKYSFADSEGLLEPCAPGIFGADPIPSSVVTNIGTGFFGAGMLISKLGLDEPCALQNWSGRNGDDFTFPRALDAYASPSVININSVPQRVTFHADSVAFGGPYRARFFECYPNTPDSLGGCDSQSTVTQIVVREANAAGVFEGRWTLLKFTDLFQFTRMNDCPSAWPDGSGQNPTCSYELKFALNSDGIPILQKPMQIVLLNGIDGEPIIPPGFSSYFPEAVANYVIPMVFIPGSASQIVIDTSANLVSPGASVAIGVTVSGNLDPSSLPTVSLGSRAVGQSTFTQIGQSKVDSNGETSFDVIITGDTELQASIAGTASGATVSSNIILIEISETSDSPTLTILGAFESIISQMQEVIPRVRRKFKKAQREEQQALRRNLRALANELSDFYNSNSTEIATQGRLVRNAKRRVAAFSRKTTRNFSKRKKQANRALRKLRSSLPTS